MNTGDANRDKTIELTEFRVHFEEILEQLDKPGIVLTKGGLPVARITPWPASNNEALLGSMKNQISIQGDIFSTGLPWDAQS